MSEFSVTVSELRNKAELLQELNAQFMSRVQHLQEIEGSLRGMWEGEAKEAFHVAFSNDVNQMHRFHQEITRYIQALHTIASEYSKTEAQNTEIARTRTY